MRQLANAMLIAATIMTTNGVASAGSNSVGMAMTTDRDPDDFDVPKDLKYELSGAHTFDDGLILGGSFQYTDTTFSDRASQNLEATLGYRMPLDSVLSVNGSAGLGEHWRENPSTYFPYYVLRIGADLELTQNITWNAISYRFRDAFDRDDDYNTPQIATGVTFKLAGESSVAVKIMRNWKDDQPSSTGVSLGFKQRF
jgi:Outer membrane protein beta-barrel domain